MYFSGSILRHIELKVCHCIFLSLLHSIVFSLHIKSQSWPERHFSFFTSPSFLLTDMPSTNFHLADGGE